MLQSNGDTYVAEVFHRHPGSGHIKVGSLAPLTLHIFIVILFVFQLCIEPEIQATLGDIALNSFLPHIKLEGSEKTVQLKMLQLYR